MARVLVPATELTPPKAALTTALTGTNNDLVFTARQGGPGGNSIRVEYIVAGNNTLLTVVVRGYDITVNVATSGGGAATSTSALVKAALEANSDATRLVSLAHAASNDGTGIVTALTFTALAGGNLSTLQPALTDGDATNGHYITGNDGLTVIEVVSSDGSTRTVSVEYSPYYTPLADVAAEVVSIAAGATRIIGPFSNGAFDQNAARDVYFTPSISSTIDFRAYRVTRAA
jgi:hypothetical protein